MNDNFNHMIKEEYQSYITGDSIQTVLISKM